MNPPMKYSLDGLHLTGSFEGDRLVAYQDVRGIWTIGHGHTKGVYKGMTCTPDQDWQWLREDIAWAESEVNRHVTVQLTQGEFDACVDFTFNCGAGNYNHSTLLKLINAGDFTHAANEFEKWAHAGGVVVAGLLRRRLAEKAEFLASVTS